MYLICSSNSGLEPSAVHGIIGTTSGDVWSRSANVPSQRERVMPRFPDLVCSGVPQMTAEHVRGMMMSIGIISGSLWGQSRKGSMCNWYHYWGSTWGSEGKWDVATAGRVLLPAHELSRGIVVLGIQSKALPFLPEFQARLDGALSNLV